MRRSFPNLATLTILVILAGAVPAKPSSLELLGDSSARPVRWRGTTIRIALSSSLSAPSAGIKPDSDVPGAVRRALNTWATAAGIKFVEVSSKGQSISPSSAADGVNLITIAPTTENLAAFGGLNNTARTRLFFDEDTGEISEADIALNPFVLASDGNLIEFSTDGTPGTYDLESTLAHEIGHLLGLDHSSVIGSTMQPYQALNGTSGFPAFGQRTLSEVDRNAIRAIYGPRESLGTFEGKILSSVDGRLQAATSALVWLEDVASGRVMASGLTGAVGGFSISGLAPGEYRAMVEYLDEKNGIAPVDNKSGRRRRPFRSVEMASSVRITADKVTSLTYVLVPPQNSTPVLIPQFLGTNGDISTVPVAATPGATLTLYVGGIGLDDIPGSGLSVSSPHISVDAASLTSQQPFEKSTPVISFEITLAANTPPGDYTIRFQSNSGETAYLVGGITVEPSP